MSADATAIRTPQAPALLTRAAIIQVDDRSYREVEVPELGGVVRVASMSGTARAALEALTRRIGEGEFVAGAKVEAFIVAQCVVDEHGARVFDDADADALLAKNGAVLARIAKVAAEISGVPMGDDDPVEVAAGN